MYLVSGSYGHGRKLLRRDMCPPILTFFEGVVGKEYGSYTLDRIFVVKGFK